MNNSEKICGATFEGLSFELSIHLAQILHEVKDGGEGTNIPEKFDVAAPSIDYSKVYEFLSTATSWQESASAERDIQDHVTSFNSIAEPWDEFLIELSESNAQEIMRVLVANLTNAINQDILDDDEIAGGWILRLLDCAKEKDSVTIKAKTFVPVAPEEGESSHILSSKSFWCDCDGDHENTYHDDKYDDAGNRVSKHHYTCNGCSGITQVG